MKKANQYTKEDVKRKAFSMLYSGNNILLNHSTRKYRLDKRYNFNREVLAFFRANQLPENERQRVKDLRRQRAKNKPVHFATIFEQPIVKDWIKNGSGIKRITGERLQFWDGRNHWAKNEKDKRILSILSKYRTKK